ncbi:MAG: hypothetical protein FDZ69_07455 [Deltaproteobacteria bacterium]|nr:MAG: hypothetical protein FDZ69_07455 [Deltaproteobacteria bacterium]
MDRITVRAKITAGTHPVHGPIVKDQEYRIHPHEMADELFEVVENRPLKSAEAASLGGDAGETIHQPAPSGKKTRR